MEYEEIGNAFMAVETVEPENREAVMEMLEKWKLRWNVKKEPLYIKDDGITLSTPYFAVVREDTGVCLAACKEGYTPYQNSKLGELLFRVAEKTGYALHSGGSLEGGRKIYMQLDCRSELRDLGKNGTTVRGYTTGINSHDGTTRLKWGNVSFTVCCKNTFLHAESLLANSYKHTAGIQEEVDMSVRNVLALGLKEAELFRLFRRMSEVPLSGNMIRNVVREVSGIDMDSKTIGEDHSTKLIKKSERLLSSITTETAQKGNTLWGLFSGITHFTSHVMSNRRGENARLTNKYLGSGLKVDNNTISYLSSFIK